MAHDDRAVFAVVTYHRGDVRDEKRHAVLLHAFWLVATVVATQVERDDFEIARKCVHLIAPRVPEIGKSVDHHY